MTHSSNQGEHDANAVRKVDVQVEEEDGNGDGQDLFAIGSDRHCQGLMRERATERVPAACQRQSHPSSISRHQLTPVFLFAEKLTTLRPKAIIPLINNAKALSLVISVAPYPLTRSSSPDHQP
jgi:hypothetical protein